MKIDRVEYSRLFNLENYNNERITLSAIVDGHEDPMKVMGTLIEKVNEIHEFLEFYRETKEAVYRVYRNIEDLRKERIRLTGQIEDIKTRMEKERAREEPNYCFIQDMSKVLEQKLRELQHVNTKLSEYFKLLSKQEKLLNELDKRIKEGNLSLEGL